MSTLAALHSSASCFEDIVLRFTTQPVKNLTAIPGSENVSVDETQRQLLWLNPYWLLMDRRNRMLDQHCRGQILKVFKLLKAFGAQLLAKNCTQSADYTISVSVGAHMRSCPV